MKMNRVRGASLLDNKEMKKTERGHFVSQVERNTNVICVRWNDNKAVSLISLWFCGTSLDVDNFLKGYSVLVRVEIIHKSKFLLGIVEKNSSTIRSSGRNRTYACAMPVHCSDH